MIASSRETSGAKVETDSAEFLKHAVGIAEQYTLDVHDIRDAYRSKPESLSAHYNAMSNARTQRLYAAVVTAASLVVAARNPLLAVGILMFSGMFGVMEHTRLKNIGTAVRAELTRHKPGRTSAPGVQ